MCGTEGSHDFAYVHSDIPEGMTIRAWRAQRVADDIARGKAARANRRRPRVRRMQERLEALHMPLRRLRLHSREAEG